ncbi:hypothetical protein AB0G00_30405 [Nocardia salmonicida]
MTAPILPAHAVGPAGQHIQPIEQAIAAELGAESLTVVRDRRQVIT